MREWEASPGDMHRLRAAITLGRRAGQPVGWLLDQELLAPTTFSSQLRFVVWAAVPREVGDAAWEPTGRSWSGPWLKSVELGRTPGLVEIPPHMHWWIAPQGYVGKALPAVLDEVARTEAAGLDLSNSKVTSPELARLAEMPSLRAVLLEGCTRVDDRVTEALPAGLRLLSLSRCARVTTDAYQPLQGHEDLTTLLHMNARGGVGRCFPPGLTQLSLVGAAKFSNADCAAIGELAQLRSLSLCGCGLLTRAGIAHLGRLRHLRDLDLSFCGRLTDAALDALLSLPIESLRLGSCTGLSAQGLLRLSALQRLRHLDVHGLNWTGETRARLRAALPGVQIAFELARLSRDVDDGAQW